MLMPTVQLSLRASCLTRVWPSRTSQSFRYVDLPPHCQVVVVVRDDLVVDCAGRAVVHCRRDRGLSRLAPQCCRSRERLAGRFARRGLRGDSSDLSPVCRRLETHRGSSDLRTSLVGD